MALDLWQGSETSAWFDLSPGAYNVHSNSMNAIPEVISRIYRKIQPDFDKIESSAALIRELVRKVLACCGYCVATRLARRSADDVRKALHGFVRANLVREALLCCRARVAPFNARHILHSLKWSTGLDQEIRNGIPPEEIILAGFSQGATIALHAALSMEEQIGGVVALSMWHLPSITGSDVSASSARESKLPVLFCHGAKDRVITADFAKHMCGEMAGSLQVNYLEFDDLGHSICADELSAVRKFLLDHVPGQAKYDSLNALPPTYRSCFTTCSAASLCLIALPCLCAIGGVGADEHVALSRSNVPWCRGVCIHLTRTVLPQAARWWCRKIQRQSVGGRLRGQCSALQRPVPGKLHPLCGGFRV